MGLEFHQLHLQDFVCFDEQQAEAFGVESVYREPTPEQIVPTVLLSQIRFGQIPLNCAEIAAIHQWHTAS